MSAGIRPKKHRARAAGLLLSVVLFVFGIAWGLVRDELSTRLGAALDRALEGMSHNPVLPSPGEELRMSEVATGTSAASFVSPPEKVAQREVTLRLRVHKDLVEKWDVWVGVRPKKCPDSLWIQPGRVSVSEVSQLVTLGESGGGTFVVCIVTCSKGSISRACELSLADARKLGLEIVATHTIERTE